MQLENLINSITPTDENLKIQAKEYWNTLAKPLYGMGILEDMVCKIYAILGHTDISRRCVCVMCADNGIVEENVTQCGSEVTAAVAHNMTVGDATISIMSKCANADVFVYDMGMLTDAQSVTNKKVAYGTKNFLHERAMTKEQAILSILHGIETVKEKKEQGYNLIVTGEMGIGNTTTSSALTSLLLDVDPALVTGKGAGLTDVALLHKMDVIKRAIALHSPDKNDPIDMLSAVGGFDIGAMCGLFLGGAIYKVPVVIDGLISYVAALLAVRLSSVVTDYMIPSHMSGEPATKMLLEELSLKAPLNCNMALGEGTGGVAMLPVLDMAIRVYNEMPSFKKANFVEYKPL